MNFRKTVGSFTAIISLVVIATGCTFFEAPVTDPAAPIPSSLPAPSSTTPSATTTVESIPEDTSTRDTSNSTEPAPDQASVSPSYLVAAPIDSFPKDATNIAVVHLTRRSTSRDLALCKALMENSPAVDVQEVPPNALTVIVWPLPNDNASANCIEMITEYEAIDITAAAEKQVDANAAGPFLLTRHLPSGQRMIYDFSFMRNGALAGSINQWLTLLGSDPANWPPYRRAQ